MPCTSAVRASTSTDSTLLKAETSSPAPAIGSRGRKRFEVRFASRTGAPVGMAAYCCRSRSVAAICMGSMPRATESTAGGITPTYCTFVQVSTARAARSDQPTQLSQLGEKLPVRMLHDRLLVSLDSDDGERRSGGGIVIPATARMGKRLSWAAVIAVGAHVRTVETGDRVLFDPEDRAEVELHGVEYILLRERDVHAVASERIEDGATGLYL